LDSFRDLDSSAWHKGVVQGIASFGAFVEVTLEDGAKAKGLVHISQLRDGFVDNVYDEVEEGQEVQVRVLSVDGRGKMSLSMREGGGGAPRRGPSDVSPFEDIASDQWLSGKVARIASFGAFVTVTAPDSDAEADGLVHITQIRDGYVENVADELEVGQEVQVRVVSVDIDASKLGLSMKEEWSGGDREPADLSPFEGVEPDQWLSGKVARIASFGAFVTVTAPDSDAEADGLVHITQIRDGYVENVADELEVGQEVQVRIVSVDVEGGKMGLSMVEENAEEGEEGEEEDVE